MAKRGYLYLITILLALLLAACAGNGKKWNPDDYTVKSGDTVYSIAWRYEVDAEQFAEWNNLSASKLIRPGQRLHTRKPAGFVSSRKSESTYSGKVASAPKRTARTSSPKRTWSNKQSIRAVKGDSLSRISKKTGVSVKRLIQLNQLKKPYVIHPGQKIYLKPLKSASKPTTKPKTASKPSNRKSSTTKKTTASKSKVQTVSWPKSVRWKRPSKGKVVKKFNRRRNDAKGLEYQGKLGDPIVAAADGKVVYSGNGLISYGNLIIIKHNKTYLSAYAYNRRLLVSEGDIVKAGQKIAEMGKKDKRSTRLHFEIRKNGKPVDPLKYLPW